MPTNTTDHILTTHHTLGTAGVATPFTELNLNRPEKRNALLPGTLATLTEHINAAATDPDTRAICITANGPTFCAGFDLHAMAASPNNVEQLLSELAAAVAAMRNCPKPVVLAAQGAAVAGGCALLAGADLVIADANCKLGYPVANLGLSPAVSAPTLRARIGPGNARTRLLSPRLTTADHAKRTGLIDITVPVPEDTRPRAHNETQKLAAKGPAATAATKRWLNEIEQALAHTTDATPTALATSHASAHTDEFAARITAAINA